MKILQYEEYNGRVLVSVLYQDNTFATINMLSNDNREEILKDVYIISNDARNRQPFEGEIPTDLEEWNPPASVATTMTVDFYNLTGKVYDQYGTEMVTDVVFSVDNPAVRIENGKIIEDVVDNDTSYFIVAKVGDLEERVQRTVYAPVPETPSELDILKKQVEILSEESEIKDDLLQELILTVYQ